MKSCFRYLLFLLSAFVFNSCSNEIDVLADYEENAAIYALLDPSQQYQFVKINKVFTNPGAKASEVAKISDSLYFDTIAPVLVELDNGTPVRTIPLFKANVMLKDSGTFANAPNYLYVTNQPISQLRKYRLDMWLPRTGKYVTAMTNMVVMPPFSFTQPVSVFQVTKIISIPTVPNASMVVSFTTGVNGRIYDAFFNFNYEEINKADTNIRDTMTISWKIIRSFRAINDKGNESVFQRIPGILFYNLLVSKIPANPDVKRRFLPCTIEFTGGNQQLDNYIEASIPSIGIVQKQTDYTNIINGIGLFGSRNTLYIDEIQLNSLNKTFIRTDPAYKYLGFE